MRRSFLFVTFCLLALPPAGAQDRSTPEATVRTFISALWRGDMKQVAACVKGVQASEAAMNEIGKQIVKDRVTIFLADAKTTQNGESANVTGKVTVKSGESEKEQDATIDVKLLQADGNWLIVPDAQKVRQGNPDIVNAIAYVLTDPTVFEKARGRAQGVSCLSNMKQIGIAALMYAQDWDEKYKLKAETYTKSLQPYTKNMAIFHCPAVPGNATSYSFNAALAGLALAKIKYPAQTVLVYEGKNGKLDFRHNGRATVGFADGHVMQVNAVESKKLRWKP